MESLGCHDIKEYQGEWRAALPDGTNKTAVCVKKNNLSSAIRCGDGNKMGDIFTLVMEIKDFSFGKANKYLHKVLGLTYTYNSKEKEEEKNDPLQIFKKVRKKRHTLDKDVPIYDDSCMKEYVDLPYIGWIREGVMPFACKRFNIGYSYDRKRIVIPERKWDGDDNDYIGETATFYVNAYGDIVKVVFGEIEKVAAEGSFYLVTTGKVWPVADSEGSVDYVQLANEEGTKSYALAENIQNKSLLKAGSIVWVEFNDDDEIDYVINAVNEF